MRVYELAKEAGVTSADVIKAAEAAGIAVASAISAVDGSDADRLRGALAAGGSGVLAKREDKRRRAAELNAKFFAEQSAKLAEHLRVAKAAAEGGKQPAAKSAEQAPAAKPGPESAAPADAEKPAAPAKPAIRMAPGYKPKAAVAAPAFGKIGLTHAGFKPLQKAKPAPLISISVAAPPKPKPPKPVSYDDYERGNRKGKKDREGQKSFDKRVPRVAQVVPQQGGRISVDETNREISIRGAVIVRTSPPS